MLISANLKKGMSLCKKLFIKIRRVIVTIPLIRVKRFYWRYSISNKDFSVICNNCLGGMVLHELGMAFNSPFVNLYIIAEDYILLLENLDYFLKEKIEDITPPSGEYPVGLLGRKITLHFLHYKTFKEAQACWERRCKRIKKDNLYIIMTERDGCTSEHIKRFDRLSYKHKIIFVSHRPEEYKFHYYIKGFENEHEVDIRKENPITGLPLWFDIYWPAFFNQK